jgi:hypothetical protein
MLTQAEAIFPKSELFATPGSQYLAAHLEEQTQQPSSFE